MEKCAICRKHSDTLIKWENARVCLECYPLCLNCSMNKYGELFWEAHQTMSDGKVWCVNAKRA